MESAPVAADQGTVHFQERSQLAIGQVDQVHDLIQLISKAFSLKTLDPFGFGLDIFGRQNHVFRIIEPGNQGRNQNLPVSLCPPAKFLDDGQHIFIICISVHPFGKG